VNAVARMQINDHSWVHIQIVANIGLKLLRQLTKHHIQPSVVRDYGYDDDDAEVVVPAWRADPLRRECLSTARGHEDFQPLPRRAKAARAAARHLPGARSDDHRLGGARRDHEPPRLRQALTLEAGIVRVADALDMEQGRSRIPSARGSISIHSLSAAAIEDVAIKDGEQRPVLIEITMNNSSGIYQVDSLLKAKLQARGWSNMSRSSRTSTPRRRSAWCRSTGSRPDSEGH